MAEVAAKTEKVETGKDKKEKAEKINIKQLIRDASAGKLKEDKFTETITKHYKAAGRENEWVKNRIKQLWKEVKKPAQKKS